MDDLFDLAIGKSFAISIHVGGWVVAGFGFATLILIFYRLWKNRGWWNSLEIDEAEFGLGQQRFRLSPNLADRQIAYRIWVELSTRKIGLPIDLEHDVLVEIYDSWFKFFSVTRDLIKEIPVQKFRRKDTKKIVNLSIEVLNVGIRPHLTRWQARFRRWYERQLSQDANGELHPQQIQKRFPEFSELSSEMLDVNVRLMRYRAKMFQLASGQ